MPLRTILEGKAPRCRANAKSTGTRCWRLASFSTPVCYVHGARRRSTIREGRDHPGWKHGKYTKAAKAEERRTLQELRDIEDIGHAIGMLKGPRMRGRKPKA